MDVPDTVGGLWARDVGGLAALMRVLADETRLRLLALLRDGELNVTQLVERTGFDQPAVSHHLGILRGNRLVLARRSGKQVFYRLSPAPREPGALHFAAGAGGGVTIYRG